MSISGIPAASRIGLQTAATPSTANPSQAREDLASAGTTPSTAEPHPPAPRFPWLSRLSAQLEKASNQPSPFAPAPLLGDHVDRSV